MQTFLQYGLFFHTRNYIFENAYFEKKIFGIIFVVYMNKYNDGRLVLLCPWDPIFSFELL